MACLKWAAGHVRPRCGGVAIALSVTIVAGLSLYFACHHQVNYQDDFRVYLAGARDLAGGTLYSRLTHGEFFTYPPFAALVFAPLAKIPDAVAQQIGWALLNDAALTALIACSLKAARPDLPAGRRRLWALGLAGPAFLLNPVLLTVRHGQVNLLLAALVVWDLAGSRRIGSVTVPLGAGTGLAAAVKLTPLIFVPYLLLTRRYAAAWRCAGVFALCQGVAFAVSPASSAAYWTRYVFDYPRAGGYLGIGALFSPANQNLLGALARFHHAPVPTGVVWALAGLTGAAGLLLAALVHARWSVFPGVIVCATTGLIISPVTWAHHLVWVLPAIIWLAAAPQRPRWGRGAAAATAVLCWAAPVWWVPGGNLSPLHENGWQLLAGNSFFAWLVVFPGAVAVAALRRTPAPPPEHPVTGEENRDLAEMLG